MYMIMILINDENIYIETFNLGDVKNTHIIHKDNINIFDSILYDNYEWLIRKCLLPLAGIVYIDSEFKTYSISLQYFIYKLGFEFDNDSILINELLLDYSNNVILGKHIYKDLSYFIDLPLPINDTNDEESEDSFVNDSYYEDIDEVVDK